MSKDYQTTNSLSKPQWIAVAIAIVVSLGVYYGFSLKNAELGDVEAKRSLNSVVTSDEIIIRNAKNSISEEQNDLIHALQKGTGEDTPLGERVENLKTLSGKWYDFGYPIISAKYAADIAEIEASAEAWGIAGATYFVALKNTGSEENREYAAQKAVSAFESAISLDPENVDHRVNLALTYAERPPQDNPMQGIMILLDVNKKHPDNIPALKALARLGIKTGQFEKAQQRLEKIVSLSPTETSAWCLLVQVYKELNLQEQYNNAVAECKSN